MIRPDLLLITGIPTIVFTCMYLIKGRVISQTHDNAKDDRSIETIRLIMGLSFGLFLLSLAYPIVFNVVNY